ncbi:LVIVD repeat-containing protein [Roseomonas sp. BN140053]|uniref:LVIVD repeat-containing protein n=1 Tax=Roseomonas sp. BN140053 TaxID=3391898 RepID=UPI0039EA3325
MPDARNTRLLSSIDCPGGGQVWVEGNTLFVAHMSAPAGTSIFDIADPRNPRLLSTVEMPAGWHSHKVRVRDGLMLVNHERQKPDADMGFGGGLGIYDVSDPTRPRQITKWRTGGPGVHRFDFDGRYAYISPSADGFIGNFVMILDLLDPANPREAGRWWIPGQNAAAGEEYPWPADYPKPRCHHPLRLGDRLYVSYWHHGFFILDISDLSRPSLVSAMNSSPAHPHPTHTCLPIPQPLKGRQIMVVADEDVSKLRPSPPAFSWVYDITDERQPMPIATFDVPGLDRDGSPQPNMTGCHQPSEVFTGTRIPFAWFAQGLRIVDFADPFRPQEVGHFRPDPPPGCERASSNDVTTDARGLIYLTDRQRGVHVIEAVA